MKRAAFHVVPVAASVVLLAAFTMLPTGAEVRQSQALPTIHPQATNVGKREAPSRSGWTRSGSRRPSS
jgi:hypothetical protein